MCEYCDVNEEGYLTNVLYDVVPSMDYADDLIYSVYVFKNKLVFDCWKPNPREEELEEHTVRGEINYCPMCGRNLKERSNELE